MRNTPIVYLDSQDISRFGDVLRGKSDGDTEKIFIELEKRKNNGAAIFVLTMPILGEIFQYDRDFRETTLKKAEAAERLCGRWALPYPSRLVAAEFSVIAQKFGLLEGDKSFNFLSEDRYWYPNISEVFEKLKDDFESMVDKEVSLLNLPSRSLRRRAKSAAMKLDFRSIPSSLIEDIEEKYGIKNINFKKFLMDLMKGKIGSEQASRIFFSSIVEPKNFVEVYFEKISKDNSLPEWISGFGKKIQEILRDFRNGVGPYIGIDDHRVYIENMIKEQSLKIGPRVAIEIARSDAKEFHLDEKIFMNFKENGNLMSLIPSSIVISSVIYQYINQIIGLSGGLSKIEDSFGGDLIHALYMPHVDLWRGDRRFSALIKRGMPIYANRIVPLLRDLPEIIDAWPGRKNP
ncbi:hypothetical protein [Zavarzinia sp.]|uniref:hypothetical protein n=1 Tax=Zavarzinia sp. TaxID=2027920 RepID=UPI003BB4B4AD